MSKRELTVKPSTAPDDSRRTPMMSPVTTAHPKSPPGTMKRATSSASMRRSRSKPSGVLVDIKRAVHPKEWVGSPSSYKSFTFSTPVNNRIVNQQDPPIMYSHFTGSERLKEIPAPSKDTYKGVMPRFLEPGYKKPRSPSKSPKKKRKSKSKDFDVSGEPISASDKAVIKATRPSKASIRRDRKRQEEEYRKRREDGWKQPPASFKKLSFSSTANRHIKNLQEIPPVVKFDLTSYEFLRGDKLPTLR